MRARIGFKNRTGREASTGWESRIPRICVFRFGVCAERVAEPRARGADQAVFRSRKAFYRRLWERLSNAADGYAFHQLIAEEHSAASLGDATERGVVVSFIRSAEAYARGG
jgi:hypothetical protein